MIKFIGTLAFLLVIFCVIMLIASIFKRRMNTKLWIICGAISMVVLLVSYYVDISSDSYKEKYDEMVEYYSE